MRYKVDNVKNYKKLRGWLCGQFFPEGSIQKNDQLEVKYGTLAKGESCTKHYHPQGLEVTIIISGKVQATLDDKEYILGPGDFIYFKSEVRELITALADTKMVTVRTPSLPNNKIEV